MSVKLKTFLQRRDRVCLINWNIIFFGCVMTVIFLSYYPLWLWVIERWFVNINSYIHPVLLIILIGLAVHQHIWKKFELRKRANITLLTSSLLVITIERLQAYLYSYSILSAILWVSAILILVASFYTSSLSKRKLIVWSLLAYSVLPVLPMIGSTLGIVTRQLYVEIIMFLSQTTNLNFIKQGTSIISGSYITHVDSSCSGIQGAFPIFIFISLLYLFRDNIRLNNPFKFMSKAIGIFLTLNGLRVLIVVLAHNNLHIQSISIFDQFLSTLTFSIIIWFILIKTNVV